MFPIVDTITSTIKELLLPRRCQLCGEGILLRSERGAPLCSTCAQKLVPIGSPWCERCGMPLISEQNICLRCRGIDFMFEYNRAIYSYSGILRDLLMQYKFHDKPGLSLFFGAILYRYWASHFSDIPIVPIPGNPRTIARRGWDQTKIFLAAMRRHGKVPSIKILRRRRSKSQKKLSHAERQQNITHAIFIPPNHVPLPSSVVLLDDVFTTGATLNWSAQLLKQAGVKKVYGLTLAID